MLEQLNRQRVYQNSRVPYTTKPNKQPLEETNSFIVKYQRKSWLQKIKALFRKKSKSE